QPIPVAKLPGGDPANPAPTTKRFRVNFAGSPVPPDATGVLLNVTSVQDSGSGGYLVVFPGQGSAPNASTLNPIDPLAFNCWGTGVAPAGGPNVGTIAVFSTNTLDVAIDVVGYLAPSAPASLGTPTFLTPVRAVDTRATGGGIVHTGFQPNG